MTYVLFALSVLYHYSLGHGEGETARVNSLAGGVIDNASYHTFRLTEEIGYYGTLVIAYYLASGSLAWSLTLTLASICVGVPIYDREIQCAQGYNRWTSPHPWRVSFWVFRWTFYSPKWQPAMIPVGIAIVIAHSFIRNGGQ